MKTIAKAAKKLMPINSQFIVDYSTPASLGMAALRLAMPPEKKAASDH